MSSNRFHSLQVKVSEQCKRRRDLHNQIEMLIKEWPGAKAVPWSEFELPELATDLASLHQQYKEEYGKETPTLHASSMEILQSICDMAKRAGAWDQAKAAQGLKMAKRFARAAREKGVIPVEIEDSDVAGHAMTGVSYYCKLNKKHADFSVMTSQAKHVGIMLKLFENAKENPRAGPALFRSDGQFHPVGLLRSDNGADQSVKSIPTLLALWQLFKRADLDVLEKGGFCPGHSKMNPKQC